MTEVPALHQMNPQSRFTSRAEDYAKYRPSYPRAVIDRIVADLGDVSQLVAADLGAGTGISSRLLADRGIKVVAIEPNVAMREVAQTHPLVEFRDGSAEDTSLVADEGGFDLNKYPAILAWFKHIEANPKHILITDT